MRGFLPLVFRQFQLHPQLKEFWFKLQACAELGVFFDQFDHPFPFARRPHGRAMG
jgi:hypothetical protein